MKVSLMVGARPQIIQAVPVVRELMKRDVEHEIIHTGQHYSKTMSENFFKSFDLPEPVCNLNVGSGTHHYQVGQIIERLGEYLHNVELAMVLGDTNSTLACALACFMKNIPIIHFEAGARSFDKTMPEEVNRIAVDRLSDHLFAPTENCFQNLKNEKLTGNILLSGDVMLDLLLQSLPFNTKILTKLHLKPDSYAVLTLHRPFNVDDEVYFFKIITELERTGVKYIFPAHPRVPCFKTSDIFCIEPLNYYEFLSLVSNSSFVVTDSGTLQREAYWLGKHCFTVRPNTEWIETRSSNILVKPDKLRSEITRHPLNDFTPNLSVFGDGKASGRIVDYVKEFD